MPKRPIVIDDRRARLVALLTVAVTCAAPSRHARAQQLRPLEIEAALGTLSVNSRMPVDLSPDGQWVAYTVHDARRRESPGDDRYKLFTRTGAFSEAVACDIWISDTRTGGTQNLTGGQGTSSNPVWSPDGSRLAFFSDRSGTYGLWLWERATGAMRQLTDVIPRPFFGFAGVRWSADGKRLVLKALPASITVAQAAELFVEQPAPRAGRVEGATVVIHDAGDPATDGSNSRNVRYLSDIVVVDLPSGIAHRVATRTHAVGYWIAADGSSVAYTDHKGAVANTQQQQYDLVLVEVGGSSRVLVRDLRQEYAISVSWSPDGTSLAYTTAGQAVQTSEAFLVPIAGGEPRRVSLGEHASFGHSYRAPLWDRNGEQLFFLSQGQLWRSSVADGKTAQVARIEGREMTEVIAPANNTGRLFTDEDGHFAYVTTRDGASKRVGFAKIDLANGACTVLCERDQYFSEGLWTIDVADDGRTIVWVAQDAQHGEDLWVANAAFANQHRLTHINPQFDGLVFGGSRVVEWNNDRGETLRGALLLPAGYEAGKRYPLVVKVYGGSMLSNGVHRFGGSGAGVENLQLLATRGYAVLLPDVPQRAGTPMADIATAVLPGVDKVIELLIADGERLGVIGHSYGGYSTLALIVQTKRFKAAVSSAGSADLFSTYAQMRADGGAFGIGWSETGQGLMGGTPWQYRDRYLANSPWFFLDQVATPLFIVQGALDRTVPAWQADAVFVALRRLGKEVVYAKYEGEDHWQGTWGRANAIDYWQRVIDWFDRHLGPTRTGSKDGGHR